MKIIYSEIKTGATEIHTKGKLVEISEELIDFGAEDIIAGCTDVSLALTSEDLKVPYHDSLDILADMVVERACKLPKAGRDLQRAQGVRSGRSTTGEVEEEGLGHGNHEGNCERDYEDKKRSTWSR